MVLGVRQAWLSHGLVVALLIGTANLTSVAAAETIVISERADASPLQRRLRSGIDRDAYLATALSIFQHGDVDRNGLDTNDLIKREQQIQAQQRVQDISLVMRFDLNGDFVVTDDEVGEFGASNRDSRTLERYDGDGDGQISLKEVLVASARLSRLLLRNDDDIPRLMALAGASDGRLTRQELENAANTLFDSVDLDHDGIIASNEFEHYQASLPKSPPRLWMDDVYCRLVAPKASESIVLYGAHPISLPRGSDGKPSPASMMVVIPPGSTRLYLILTSSEAIHWNFQGATRRIGHVVAISDDQNLGAGSVTGVRPKLVRAIKSDGCIGHFTRTTDSGATRARAAVALLFGREPDLVLSTSTQPAVVIP